MLPDNPACFANHMGFWLCEPLWLRQAITHIRAGTWSPEARSLGDGGNLFQMSADGIAVIPISGMKVIQVRRSESDCMVGGGPLGNQLRISQAAASRPPKTAKVAYCWMRPVCIISWRRW